MKSISSRLFLGLLFTLILNPPTFAACPASGTGINANGTTVSETGCTITTSTSSTPGILA